MNILDCPECKELLVRNYKIPGKTYNCKGCNKYWFELPNGKIVNEKEWDEFCKPFSAGE